LSEEVASKNNKMLMSGNLLNVPLFTGAEKVKYKRKESSGARDSGSIFNCSLRLDLLQIFINTLLKNRTRRRDRIIYYLHSRPALKKSAARVVGTVVQLRGRLEVLIIRRKSVWLCFRFSNDQN
jgi:hypothetical protein